MQWEKRAVLVNCSSPGLNTPNQDQISNSVLAFYLLAQVIYIYNLLLDKLFLWSFAFSDHDVFFQELTREENRKSYLGQGGLLVPITRLVMFRTGIRSRIALVVVLLSRSIVSTVTCNMKISINHQSIQQSLWENREKEKKSLLTHTNTHLGISTQSNVFLQEVSPPVILLIDINFQLFFAQLASRQSSNYIEHFNPKI